MRTWEVRSAEDLGSALAELRKDRGFTQEQLAEMGSLGRTWLSKLEGGRSSAVLDHLLRLFRRMGATLTITWDDGGG